MKIVGGTRGTKLLSLYYNTIQLSFFGTEGIYILLKARSRESLVGMYYFLVPLWAFSFRSWIIFVFACYNFYFSFSFYFFNYFISLSFFDLNFFLLVSSFSFSFSLSKYVFFDNLYMLYFSWRSFDNVSLCFFSI